MNKAHEILDISFVGMTLRMRVDGKLYEIDLASISRRLARATQEQLEAMEVSPSGYGLHWPALDEDLSIDGLIGIVHTPEIPQRTATVDNDSDSPVQRS